MLTFEALMKTQKHISAFGEGKHRFGRGCERVGKTNPPAKPEEKIKDLE